MSHKSLQFIPLHVDFAEHPRVAPVVETLAEYMLEPQYAEHTLTNIWRYTAAHRPDGVLGDMSAKGLARAAKWQHDPSVLVEALLDSGLIYRDPEVGLCIRDWSQYAGKCRRKTHDPAYNARKQRRYRDRKRAEKALPKNGNATVTRWSQPSVSRVVPKEIPHPRVRVRDTHIGPVYAHKESTPKRVAESAPAVAASPPPGPPPEPVADERIYSAEARDLASMPDEQELTPADLEAVLSQPQLGKGPVLKTLGAGARGLGPLRELRAIIAWELKRAIAKADGTKCHPGYIAAIIRNGRADGWENPANIACKSPGRPSERFSRRSHIRSRGDGLRAGTAQLLREGPGLAIYHREFDTEPLRQDPVESLSAEALAARSMIPGIGC